MSNELKLAIFNYNTTLTEDIDNKKSKNNSYGIEDEVEKKELNKAIEKYKNNKGKGKGKKKSKEDIRKNIILNKVKKLHENIYKNNEFAYIKIFQLKPDPDDGDATKNAIRAKKITIDIDKYKINGQERLAYSEKKIGFSKVQLQQISKLLQDKINYKQYINDEHMTKYIFLGKLNYSINRKDRYGEMKINEMKIYDKEGKNNVYTYRNLYEYINFETLPKLLKDLFEIEINKNKKILKYYDNFKTFFNSDKTYEDLENITNEEKLVAFNKMIIKLIDIKNNLYDKKYELYQELTNNFEIFFSLAINGVEDSGSIKIPINGYVRLATSNGRFYNFNPLTPFTEESPFELLQYKKTYVWSNSVATGMQKVIASMFRFSNYKHKTDRKHIDMLKKLIYDNKLALQYINKNFKQEFYVKISEKNNPLQIDHVIGKLNKNLLKNKNNSINNLRAISGRINVLNLNQEQVDFKSLIKEKYKIDDIELIFKPRDLEIKLINDVKNEISDEQKWYKIFSSTI